VNKKYIWALPLAAILFVSQLVGAAERREILNYADGNITAVGKGEFGLGIYKYL